MGCAELRVHGLDAKSPRLQGMGLPNPLQPEDCPNPLSHGRPGPRGSPQTARPIFTP
jgi:hypothetical protein